MKKSTIWILGVVMGLSFLSLLYLQISYIEEMVRMRNEQFDESVKRALMAASKDVESAEVARWLREDISEAEKKAWEQAQGTNGNGMVQTHRFMMTSPDGTIRSSVELKTFSNQPSELPRAMISRKHGAKTIPQTSRSLADMIKNRYLYQRALVDDVVFNMLYHASDKPIEERVNFKNLDQYIKSGLIDNGIGDFDYHFKVIDRDGREVYRCSDYSDEGSESSSAAVLERSAGTDEYCEGSFSWKEGLYLRFGQLYDTFDDFYFCTTHYIHIYDLYRIPSEETDRNEERFYQ